MRGLSAGQNIWKIAREESQFAAPSDNIYREFRSIVFEIVSLVVHSSIFIPMKT